MSDKQKLSEALASILHSGLISMRGVASTNAEYIQAESTHLHNLPKCLHGLDAEDVLYYYQTERPRYLAALRRINGQAKAYAPDYRDRWRAVARWLREAGSGGGGHG